MAANANGTTGGSEPEIVLEQAAQPACAICHKVEVAVGPVENRVTLQRCGRCRQVLYCSRDCQRAHWPRHKSDCAAPGSPPEKIDDATDARAARLVASAPKENCLEETIKSVAKEFVCPITHELPVEPVTAEDGRIYDRKAILAWFAKNDGESIISPSTNTEMGKKLLPATQARNTIETLVRSGSIDGELATAWQKKLEDEKIVKELREKAEAGDAKAMYQLGYAYDKEEHGLERDLAQARAWYERSAAARHKDGLAYFGCCDLIGVGGTKDYALGLVNVTEAAYLGSEIGQLLLGKAFAKGLYGLSKDLVRARFWLEKADHDEARELLQELGQ